MNLSDRQTEELNRLEQFINSLSAQQNKVLGLLATEGLLYKQVALEINRDIKAVEKVVTAIIRRYRDFYGPQEANASFHRIRSRAACYYFFKDVMTTSHDQALLLNERTYAASIHRTSPSS